MVEFLEYDYLTDNEIDLRLVDKIPANEKRGHVPVYRYKITLHNQDGSVGSIDLRVGETHNLSMYSGHIGYEVNPDFRGRHFASKACILLKEVALAHGINKLIITCNPDNWASRRTCELAGAKFIEIVDLPEDNDMYLDGDRQKCRYELIV